MNTGINQIMGYMKNLQISNVEMTTIYMFLFINLDQFSFPCVLSSIIQKIIQPLLFDF